jgi:hypothetical protein
MHRRAAGFAAARIARLGWPVKNMSGRLEHWKHEGVALVSDNRPV